MSFLATNKWALLFYLVITILLIIFRKKFEIHGKVVAMYRTKVGVSFMNRVGKKYAEFIKWLGYIGMGVGFIGLFGISYLLIKNLIDLALIPGVQSAVTPVIPGIAIPGSPIVIPLVTGWIGLFIVILVHEGSHGLVSRAHKIKVKNSGIFFLGPLMGAFVEPDEKELSKASDMTRYSVFAAGPWSNILLALILIVLLNFVFTPIVSAVTLEKGLPLSGVEPGFAAEQAGLTEGMVITNVNGVDVYNYNDFVATLACAKPGDELVVTANDSVYTLLLGEHPQNPDQGYLGVYASKHAETELKYQSTGAKVGFAIFNWIVELFLITGILSLGIGLVNLLPLGPLDGGHMSRLSLTRIKGEKKGLMWWKYISILMLFIIILNILWPIFRHFI